MKKILRISVRLTGATLFVAIAAAQSTTADRVYGQNGSFTTNAYPGNITASTLGDPSAIAVDGSGGIYVVDWSAYRVLHYSSGSAIADRVYGQNGSFTTNNASQSAANKLSTPAGVAADGGGGVYIADSVSSRVLHYAPGSITADRVYGQGGSFTTMTDNKGGVSANSLLSPEGVAVDNSGGLYIVDRGNNRALHYPPGSTSADRVYGQSGAFTTNTYNKGGVSANSLNGPEGIAVDNNGGIYIADLHNYRVLHYPSGSTIADRVYGQGNDINRGLANTFTNADTVGQPNSVAVDSSGGVYISGAPDRVLHFSAGSTTADRVYGQSGFFTNEHRFLSADSLSGPHGVTVDSSGGVYVVDEGNRRVLHYPGGSMPPGGKPVITPGGIGPLFSSATTVQPGSWISIYGSNLAGAIATWNNDFPKSLGGTSVTINSKPCFLWYVSPGQINLQTPDDIATGTASLVITTPSGTSTATVTLGQAGPSFSLLDGKHVAGIILRTDGSGAYGDGTYDILGPTGTSLGYKTVAAKAGDTVVLFGVGFGPTSPPVPAGKVFSGAATTTNPVQVRINNVVVTPAFSGMTSAGLYQFNLVQLPAGLGAGDVTLTASVMGVQTPSVMISLQ